MNTLIPILASILLLAWINPALSEDTRKKEKTMAASGTFDVNLEPQMEDSAPAGRMLIAKQYSGDLVGQGVGQMLSKRTEKGASVYAAIEEFEGTLAGKKGGFTLFHQGHMSATQQSLEVVIVEGSGTGELAGIQGSLTIIQQQGSHQYELDYRL